MSDDLVKQSIAELQDLVRCRCDPAYKDRGLHDPACECDNAENVKVVADHIEELERMLGLADDQRAEWERHCRAAEAKLAKAVEALQQLVIEYDEVDLAYDEPKSMTAAYVVALDTLTELTGGKDE